MITEVIVQVRGVERECFCLEARRGCAEEDDEGAAPVAGNAGVELKGTRGSANCA